MLGRPDGSEVTHFKITSITNVKVFDGTTFAELDSFFAPAPSFIGGVYVG